MSFPSLIPSFEKRSPVNRVETGGLVIGADLEGTPKFVFGRLDLKNLKNCVIHLGACPSRSS
ncbi:hypothetical protein D3C85_1409990 [compost metagenome]